MTHRAILGIPVLLGLLSGCQSAGEQAASVRAAQDGDQRLTLGTVQREIKVGMSSSQVAEVLGAPNMVTTDDDRHEVWVWDKVATNNAYSRSEGGVGLLILGVAGGSGASSTSQRTLTIIVKFDGQNQVRDFLYRSSSF